MNYLLDISIEQDVIKRALINNSKQTIDDAEWNIELVISNINYLKSIGIECIDKIIINRFDILLRNSNNLKETIDNLEDNNVIELINKDIKYIYYLDK